MTEERAVAFNSELTLKLSYEWKNIYRSLLQMDILQKGQVTVRKFNQALLSHNVSLTKEELRRLINLSRKNEQSGDTLSVAEDPMTTTIDYHKLSQNLGLHKPSLSLMTANTGAVRTENVTRRLMQQLGRKSPVRVDAITAPESKSSRVSLKALKPVQSARLMVTPGGTQMLTNRANVQQALDLLLVVDKQRSGKVNISNFMKIAQVSGLQIDNVTLMRHTDERSNTIDYDNLTQELLK
mmetsp:Transcript_20648/g.27863  ORF Transcript_20648/g.27863 Transcript_20648/m.27863 type:complete len:239 (+) Transcript_20648:2709-3425(+)|eukprot:CAMPEP_0185576622 /NCGR_PEP_ID=MMETSP0434-20130131/7505_1 /TAXON_ID=626734 ORGANISM="Favella taraikaensis, Strain Fe Narragansett Bay" /NCGR_SAMPLE_ID=MMETSP0434 /ASSEMBLY_ACC=CAM_ASM_000379 /LENGTH=238 /DNA_ID=CAMNT_0028193895 /DNA_START=2703 /DNA_END=3419 /DNA_ORIENTATION=+